MLDWITSFIAANPWNSALAIALYWSPALLCIAGYTLRTWRDYRRDFNRRAEVRLKNQERPGCSFYSPTLTVGDLVARAFLAATPIANLWAATFDIAPLFFSRVFSGIGRALCAPLVPRREP
jgi:hypothetical protein